jgi:hypothetical protein
MDEKLKAKIIAGLDAAQTMHDEFMEPSTDMRGQYDIFKAAYAKVKAARKAIDKA